ncbi:alpha/beta hydrolase [Thalassotalea litorea]|uniref:Alpha/beta hydrolase n=1 Tax=Thalassotalea litorea TaxID=2020715 RepID=A0A5R9IG61_9GAMM|nr:alpha/beta hydrolase-fold protein [Thalassotalea litorea]TLU64272.1 alpha/beta hydrolase [Thalassotalea litorea]
MKFSSIQSTILCLLLCSGYLQAKASESTHFEIQRSSVITLQSKVLDRSYDIYVKLPYDYHLQASESKTYPVLYLNDGPYTFKVAAGVTHLRPMDKVIVVGISFAHGENGQFSRVRDLTPVVDTSWKKYQTGGAPQYLSFIEKEVFSFIEQNYRANPRQRILAGQSLGGSFGAWVLLTRPELFSQYILTSPSLWFKQDWIFDLEQDYADNNNLLKANVYMATGALETLQQGGSEDMVGGHRKFTERLRARNYQGLIFSEEIIEGTDHYSTFPVGLTKGLMFVYQHIQ